MKRQRMGRGHSKRQFSRLADRMHRKNLGKGRVVMRGGIRL